MRFEEFLVEKCDVSEQQLEKALAARLRSRPPLGVLARERALLNTSQIERVLRRQEAAQTRFGEAAMELGLLSDRSVKLLLNTQQERTPTVSEFLVEMGAVDGDIYEWILDWFQECRGGKGAAERPPRALVMHPSPMAPKPPRKPAR